jgi:hypothetical protein
MSLNWIRACKLTVGGSTWTLLEPPEDSLRMRFAVRQFTTGSVNLGTIRITNPDPSKCLPLKSWEGKQMTISAGYRDNSGLLFQGQVKQAKYGRENPTDTILTIFAGDNDRNHNFAVANKTFAPGSTPQDHVNHVLQVMNIDPVSVGFIGGSVDLSQPKYPRSVTLFGLARDVLANIAKSKQAHASFQNGKLQIVGANDVQSSGAIVLNENSGLVGMPTQTLKGIEARCLINPAIKINTLIQINEGLIQQADLAISAGNETSQAQTLTPRLSPDGIYKVLQIDIDGDSRADGPWYMDLTTLASTAGGQLLPGAIPEGLGLPIAGAPG